MHDSDKLKAKTIDDFGEQWSHFTQNEGYYGSVELFADHIEPLLTPADFVGKKVADIGSGSGRVLQMLAAAGASHITAVEPASGAMQVVKKNTANIADRISYHQVPGDELPGESVYDFIVSLGVIHHIPEPLPVLRRAKEALKAGGKLVIWVYGKEGNRLYLSLALALRKITTRLPHKALVFLSHLLHVPLSMYMGLCKIVPFSLPMKKYMAGYFGKFERKVQILGIYDQLNPAWAKYYSQKELIELFKAAGFSEIQLKHRHQYSWTVVATKSD